MIENVGRLGVVLTPDQVPSENSVSKPASGQLNGKDATVGSGDQGAHGLASGQEIKEGFGAKLLAAGLSAASFPITLFTSITSAVTSAVSSALDFVTTDKNPSAFRPDEAATDARAAHEISHKAEFRATSAETAALRARPLHEVIAATDYLKDLNKT